MSDEHPLRRVAVVEGVFEPSAFLAAVDGSMLDETCKSCPAVQLLALVPVEVEDRKGSGQVAQLRRTIRTCTSCVGRITACKLVRWYNEGVGDASRIRP